MIWGLVCIDHGKATVEGCKERATIRLGLFNSSVETFDIQEWVGIIGVLVVSGLLFVFAHLYCLGTYNVFLSADIMHGLTTVGWLLSKQGGWS